MKDKENQIEEMVSIMAASNNPFIDVPIEIMSKVAEVLYNAGYRKLPKDSVIISKEEFEDYKKKVDNSIDAYFDGQHETELYYKNIQIPRERKKAVEKIYTKIKDSFLMDRDSRYKLKLWLEEEFGIEVDKNDQN